MLLLTLALLAQGAATSAPRVVGTYPVEGAVVAAGKVTIRVTFDRAMRPDSYSFVDSARGRFPDCGEVRPAVSPDARSFSIECTLRPGQDYALGFNGGSFRNFVGAGDGEPAEPSSLAFATRPE